MTGTPDRSALPTLPDDNVAAPALESSTERFAGRLMLRSRTLRQHAAFGVLINGGFLVALSSLTFVRGFVVARFLTTADYGVWGIVIVSINTLLWLKQVGVGDKFIQQDEVDQEAAFQKAFTIEAIVTAAALVLLVALLPLVSLAYGRTDIVLPFLALLALLPAGLLQTPMWVYYRRMQFMRQRTLQAIDPIVGTLVAVTLAVAGAGYWALVIGLLAGAWASAIAIVASAPYPLRWRFERGTLRTYMSYSWPLLVVSAAGLVIAQGSFLSSSRHLGLAGAGAVALAATISQFAERVDGVVSGTLYPAICAVRDRIDLLFESFVKSNRLALMWAVPFGTGLSLFAGDLISFVLGERWRIAQPLLVVFGVAAAANHIGFNWDAYFRARGNTRPMAVAATLAMLAFLATAIPLLYRYGLEGFAIGVAAQGLVHLICRVVYLNRLFHGFNAVRHALRAILPTLPATGVVLALRSLATGNRTLAMAVVELALYTVVTILATWAFERALVREVVGYLRRGSSATAAA